MSGTLWEVPVVERYNGGFSGRSPWKKAKQELPWLILYCFWGCVLFWGG